MLCFEIRNPHFAIRNLFRCLLTRTTTVFCILSDDTMPTFCTRLPLRVDDTAAGAISPADASAAGSAATIAGSAATASPAPGTSAAGGASGVMAASAFGGVEISSSFFFLLNIFSQSRQLSSLSRLNLSLTDDGANARQRLLLFAHLLDRVNFAQRQFKVESKQRLFQTRRLSVQIVIGQTT